MTEREQISNLFPIIEGASGTLYVVIGETELGLEAIELEKFAFRDEARVTIPRGATINEIDPAKVLTRFGETYKRIVKEFSPQEKPSA